MIALIEVTSGSESQHVMVDLHHDDYEEAKVDIRNLVRRYYKEKPENMSLADFLYEEMDAQDYFPIYIDIDDSIRVDGEVMSVE